MKLFSFVSLLLRGFAADIFVEWNAIYILRCGKFIKRVSSGSKKWFITAGVALLLTVMQQAQAQRRPITYTQYLSGVEGSLAKDSSRTITDSVYLYPLQFPDVDTTSAISNMVVFYVDETSLRMPPDSFKVDLEVKIYFTNRAGVSDSTALKTLTIEYNKTRPYNSKALYIFKDAPRVQVKVSNIVASYAPIGNILPMLKMENRMAIGRIFSMDCEQDAITTVSTNTDFIATKGELQVSWPSLNAAQEYDVEWTFVDQTALDAGWYNVGGTLDPNLLFRNNATRVTILKSFYLIPLLYEGEGKLFYRVRAAQTTIDGERKVTDWSSDHAVTGGLGEYTFTGHEPLLNWQASTSFAEEGKRKSVVQYFDGTLRNRQTVTKDNVTDTTIVAETFYDKQGRSVVQVLPAPSLTTLIKYNPLFNQGYINNGGSYTTEEYHQGQYDSLKSAADYCEDHAPPLSTASGSSKYYSPQNQNKNELIHRYIPDAEMYPFTEVKYTQDNTGRIASQGGVGPVFQLNSGHETKYYYGTPSQQELDALFGTEAGYASHYQKNMVRDANGQYSVSYVDMHGRTVATALAGDTAGLKLEALPSYTSTTQTDQLLTRNNNIVKGQSIESTSGLLVTMRGTHTFNYTLDAESLKLADKDNVDICYDCLYDVTITVTDDCNNQNMPGKVPYVHRASNMRIAPPVYDTTCTNTASDFNISFPLLLEPGSYVITKKLTLREDAMNWYRDSLYSPHNTVKTKEQIIAEQLEIIRAQRGNDCVQEGGPWYEYQQYREQMLLDMTPPFGQYALYPKSNEIFSIFSNYQSPRPTVRRYLFQTVSYEDNNLIQSMSPEDFVHNFQPHWAESLLRLHPEYAMLQEYEKMKSGFHWDADFEATSTYAAAAAKGYLNPLNSVTSPASGFSNGNDSLFYGGANSSIKGWLKTSMESHVSKEGVTLNLWALASIMGHCDPQNESCSNLFRNTPSNVFSGTLMCEGERDMAWRFFRDQYLRLKHKYIDQYIRSVTNPSITSPARPVFFSESMARSAAGDFLGDDKDKAIQAGRDSTSAIAARSCENYVSYWWSQLSTCNYSTADSLWLIPKLIQICKEGADSTHPFGASSIGPKSNNGYPYRSFDELITYYNSSIGKATDGACNAFLIDNPVPYSKPIALVDQPWYSRPDDATCDRIASLRTQYNASSGYSSFSDFLQQKFNTTISDADLNRLDSLCNGTFGCKFTTQPITIPPVLQPTTGEGMCVDCNQVNTVYNTFKATFPGSIPTYQEVDEQQQQTNQLFKNYMNSKLGFSKTALEYLQFLDTCNATSLSACDSLQKIVYDFRSNYSARPSATNPDTVHFGVTEVFKDDIRIMQDQYGEIFKDGYAHVPASLIQASGYPSSDIVIQKNDTLCVNNNFTIEARVKGDSATHVGAQSCKTINFIFWDQNSQVCYSPTFQMHTINPAADCGAFTYTCESGSDTVNRSMYYRDLMQWTRIKMEFKNNTAKIYVNDILITSIGYTIPVTKIRRYAFNIGSGFVDYVKVWDSTGRLTYVEEFEDCQQSPSNCPPELACNPDCSTRFTNYFNQQKGTSYTYNQIDSIYYVTCGKYLDICGNSGFSENDLENIRNSFINDYYIKSDTSQTDTSHFNTWYPCGGVSPTQFPLVFNGVAHIPDSIYGNCNYPWATTFLKKDTLCVGNDFAIEMRLKHPPSEAKIWAFDVMPNIETDIHKLGFLFAQYGPPYDSATAIGYAGYKVTTLSDSVIRNERGIDEFLIDFNDWRIIKIQAKNNYYYIYCDGRQIAQFPYEGTISKLHAYALLFKGVSGYADWVKVYDRNGTLQYVEEFEDAKQSLPNYPPAFMCPGGNCDTEFTAYFNDLKGTSYSYGQIDSIYTASGLILDVCGVDTSQILSDKLKALESEYQNQYLKPSTGYVDLDMRTFAGNKTPDEGPKGVFDVNGKLLGNTVDSTPTAIKESYVSIWNGSADNREVGTLSLLQNGKFRLALNAGKSAPCGGIIGQRYYQFEAHTKDTLIEIRTGLGSYIDFGDSSHVFVIDSVRNAKNVISRSDTMFHNYVVKSFVGDDFVPLTRFSIAHFYNHSSSYKTYNVTIYHTDVKGFVGFGEYYKYPAPTQFSNLRGYFPQSLYDFNFTGTKDSTINTTKKIKNFKQIITIQNLELNEWAFNTPLLHINFESFANNHDLRRLTLNPFYSNLPSGVADSLGGKLFSQIVPDIKNNFPNLRYLFLDSWGERSYDLANFNFEFSKAKYIEVCWQNSYPSGFVDSLYNQVARATSLDSGRFYYGYGFGGPTNTSISEASRNYLLSRGWYLVDERSYNFGPGLTEPRDIISTDSLPFYTPFSDFINSKLNTNLTAKQVDSLYLAKCGHKPITCPPADTSLRRDVLLCGKNEPANQTFTYEDIYDPPCSDSSILAYNSGTEIYNAYKDSLDQSFNSKYAAKCLGAASIESFTVQHPVSEYHYTLYYYDQAGNLVKTIPPAGVNPNRNATWLTQVAQKRKSGETQVPTHAMPTVYRYNSLNQVVSQKTPDAGKSTNWYDRLGRLAVSQNAQQLIDGKYSYTVYDHLSRITEVGQKPQPNAMTNTISRNQTSLFDWIYFNNGSNTYGAEMVTRTVYDEPSIDATPCIEELRFTQKSHTLRNRVSYTRYFEKPSYAYDSDWQKYFITGLSYTSGIDYSYDIHGNVDTMRNLYGANTYSPMTYHGNNACKTIAYHYDLISGKVNEVHYQPGQNDEFYHRYEYDAENRLTNVYTTDNKAFLYQQLLEEREAQYTYYKHGPLARTILGQQQVQGLDYIYNLQGWLKGINGNTKGTPQFDPGEDGKPGSLNQYIAEDVYGTTLRYFTGDYTAINSSAPNPFPAYEHKLEAGTYKPLYNGNISATTTSLGSYFTYLYNYRYDQLNRLVDMDTYRGFNATTNSWSGMDGVFYHREHYTYDANGNILRASRNGNLSANQLMDSLHYYYTPGTNRLEYIDDSATTVYGINIDIKDQSPGNYQYDAIGNLVSSVNRPISGIKWNVYGKIVDIQKTAVGNATANYIYYNYDPSGNRIGQVTRHNSGINTIYRYTWYVRDAQGNVIAVYKVADTKTVSSGTLQLAEHHMYGSSRLGIINRDIDADQPKHSADNSNNHLGEAFLINFTRGNKFFELTNHLGNVLSTITDNKLPTPVQNNPLLIASYSADLVTAVDYSPFGMTLPGRVYNNHWRRYRYGFNGKENDNEVQGEYNELDYGMRVYDPRVGRFLSVDPLQKQYPWYTPYQFSGNTPTSMIDLDGLEEVYPKVHYDPYTIYVSPYSGSYPMLRPSQWKWKDRESASGTFASAAKYNTNTLNSSVYKPVAQIHSYYVWAANEVDKGKANIKFFHAAREVTSIFGVGGAYSFPDVAGLSEHGQRSLADVNSRLLKENIPVIRDILAKGNSDVVNGKGIIWDFNYVKREQDVLTEVITNDPLSKKDETAINNTFKNFEFMHPEYSMAKSLLGVSEINYKNQDHRMAIGRSLVFIEHFLEKNNFLESSQTPEFKSAIEYLNNTYGERNTQNFINTYRDKLGQ